MLFLLFKKLPNIINMICLISLNLNIVLIDYNKNIKLFSQNLIHIALEACLSIK